MTNSPTPPASPDPRASTPAAPAKAPTTPAATPAPKVGLGLPHREVLKPPPMRLSPRPLPSDVPDKTLEDITNHMYALYKERHEHAQYNTATLLWAAVELQLRRAGHNPSTQEIKATIEERVQREAVSTQDRPGA